MGNFNSGVAPINEDILPHLCKILQITNSRLRGRWSWDSESRQCITETGLHGVFGIYPTLLSCIIMECI